ncbi:MAG: Holliday junction branch migration DNA helicase RuvB [Verrucomicrobia bacterium]|nr:Holliday junction branch migration DNA helicase RuvB [Verrucomicrobiota bacterium]MBS0636510.1 Holliday junction branch migration DNA helicase RuvB [Verrucomicrobiota bacterium]
MQTFEKGNVVTDRFIESSFCKRDAAYEVPLRPQQLDHFIGQDNVRDQMSVLIEAAKARSEPLGHVLFCGPPGLGKTTLSHIIAQSMGSSIVITSGPVIEKAGDLAGILTKLKEGDVLFIDEIHALNRTIEEYLYPAMEDFALDLVIDSGTSARSVKVKLNKFTLVGATTRLGLLSSPLRSRFASSMRLDYYTPKVIEQILDRSSKILNITADSESLAEIATRSRGTPRIANSLLKWVRDYAQIKAQGKLSKKITQDALRMISIDERGLDEMDSKILSVLIDHYQGGPVGIQTLAVAVGEEPHTLEEVHEPFLILQGLIKRTPRGREATSLAYQHLGKTVPKAHTEV